MGKRKVRSRLNVDHFQIWNSRKNANCTIQINAIRKSEIQVFPGDLYPATLITWRRERNAPISETINGLVDSASETVRDYVGRHDRFYSLYGRF